MVYTPCIVSRGRCMHRPPRPSLPCDLLGVGFEIVEISLHQTDHIELDPIQRHLVSNRSSVEDKRSSARHACCGHPNRVAFHTRALLLLVRFPVTARVPYHLEAVERTTFFDIHLYRASSTGEMVRISIYKNNPFVKGCTRIFCLT